MTTTIIPARERAQVPIGCAYVAPLFWNKWFRWDGSRASGHYQLGEWHPVVGWALDDCTPASDYFQEEDA